MSRHRHLGSNNFSQEIDDFRDEEDDMDATVSEDEDMAYSPSQVQYLYNRNSSASNSIVSATPQDPNITSNTDFIEEKVLLKKPKSGKVAKEVATSSVKAKSNAVAKKPKQLNQTELLNQSMSKLGVKDALEVFKRERGTQKEQLNLIIVGHVDAGKSTLMGRLLCDLGCVNSKLVHKYEQESRKIGKASFMYAWILDETDEERERGVTMDVGRSSFETRTKCVTVLDAPGHRDFIPNMITGATQADVAIVVVDATTGNFETGIEYGGQTREHALLVRSLGVRQLAVAVNKLDMIAWCADRFEEIVTKTRSFLNEIGFCDREATDSSADVVFVPCSGLLGENLVRPSAQPLLRRWYNGPCLLDVIDGFSVPLRPVQQPFRFSISDIFKNRCTAGFSVSGRIETGLIGVGDRVIRVPSRDKSTAVVKSITIGDEQKSKYAFAGEQATISLTMCGNSSSSGGGGSSSGGNSSEINDFGIGDLLCQANAIIPVTMRFEASILIFDVRVPIVQGFATVLHHQALAVPAIIQTLIATINKTSGETIKQKPRCLTANTRAVAVIETERAIAIETFANCKELGRIMLRERGSTIATGLVTRICQ